MNEITKKLGGGLYRLVNDIVFKVYFSSDEGVEFLKQFLSATLNIPLDELVEITILNPEISKEHLDQRNIILDILAVLRDGRKIHIEVQVAPHADFEHRVISQNSRLITEQLARGEKKWHLNQQISLVILDFVLFKEPKNPGIFHRRFMWRDEEGEVFSQVTQIHTVELPRIPETLDSEETTGIDCSGRIKRKNWCSWLENPK
ncbi:MAG: Rpn family recombination-promoting nuclease/putative transposase [Turicibacter sp.]|nr:Rpn family recombination-promoting nuclease/putative transposase [Turicibacter sp.]